MELAQGRLNWCWTGKTQGNWKMNSNELGPCSWGHKSRVANNMITSWIRRGLNGHVYIYVYTESDLEGWYGLCSQLQIVGDIQTKLNVL